MLQVLNVLILIKYILCHQHAWLFSPLQKKIVKITILLVKLVGRSDCYGFTHANAHSYFVLIS